jgi:acyl carrier protein
MFTSKLSNHVSQSFSISLSSSSVNNNITTSIFAACNTSSAPVLTASSRSFVTTLTNNTTNILTAQPSTNLTNKPPTNPTATTSPAHRLAFSPDELAVALEDSEEDPARAVLQKHSDYKQRLHSEEQQNIEISKRNIQLREKSRSRDFGYTSDKYIRGYLYQTLREHSKLAINPHPVLGSSITDLTTTQFDAITFDELQLDSLDRVEVLVSVEKRFDCEISDDLYFNIKNLGELVDTLIDIPEIVLPSLEPLERDPEFLSDAKDEDRTRVL